MVLILGQRGTPNPAKRTRGVYMAGTAKSINRLTDSKIAEIKNPVSGYIMVRDGGGLFLRITANGSRSFVLRFRTKAGIRHSMTVGNFSGEFGVVHARAKAHALKVVIEAGGDPLQAAADAVIEHKGRPTVARLAKEWMEAVEAECSERTAKEYQGILDKHVLPALKDKAVADVETIDVKRLVNAIRRKRKVTSNRVRSVLSAMFNFALTNYTKPPWLAFNPVTKAVKRFDEEKRVRSLTDEEFARLDETLKHCGSRQSADAVRLIYWTGSRKGETLSALWSEFDLVNGTWDRPSHHTKQKRRHLIALHPEALALLKDMKARAPKDAVYVFPGDGDGPLLDIKTMWRGLMRRAQITGFRIHDLRHTFASRLVNQGATLPEIGQLLGHTQSQTTARYAHLSLDGQRRTLARLASPRVLLPEPELSA
jgi:integrase